jgi:hypothetical protein
MANIDNIHFTPGTAPSAAMLNALADAVRALSKITGAGNIAVQKSPSGTVIMSSAVGLPPGMTGALAWYSGTQWVALAPPTVDSVLAYDYASNTVMWVPVHDCSA